MTVILYRLMLAVCWGMLALTIVGVTVAVSFNDIFSALFFGANALCLSYVMYQLKGE